jgi:ParB/RepB/Spo0J family partition protein
MSSNPSGIVKRTNFYYADPARIRIQKDGEGKRNARFDLGDLEADLGSMRTDGFYAHKPLLVVRVTDSPDYDFEVVDGERRMTYVQHLLKKGHVFEGGIPVVLEDKKSTEADMLVKMLTANTGKAFLPLEEAAAYKKMRDLGMTIKQICERTGKHPPQVNAALALLHADDSVVDAVKSGKIGSTLAKQISVKAKGDKAKQKELVEKATSSKQAKNLVKEEVERLESRRRPRLNKPQKLKPLGCHQIVQLETETYERLVKFLEIAGLSDLDQLNNLAVDDPAVAAAFLAGKHSALREVQGHQCSLPV